MDQPQDRYNTLMKPHDNVWSDEELIAFRKTPKRVIPENDEPKEKKKKLMTAAECLAKAAELRLLWSQFVKDVTPNQMAFYLYLQKRRAELQYYVNIF